MKRGLPALAVLAAFLALAGEGLAHSVSVFAFVDGDEIQVECGFSKTRKVVNGKIVVADSRTGDTILEGTTDRRGVFRFRPPDGFLATGHGLDVRLLAGEGHRDEWKIAPEELRALSRSAGAQTPAPPGRNIADARQTARAPGENRTISLSAVDIAGLEEIMGRVVDAKLAPIKQTLAQQQNDEPGLRDIVGGIGWILGLLGLATYMRHRR
ncbi:MAG: hypothetical protein LBS30_03305 [Planctomycetota bacterium]|jgi:nickel transport protein|nr:hypothetical protein [Planctomycetota bacterium]